MDFRDFIPQLQLIRPPSRRVVSATTGASADQRAGPRNRQAASRALGGVGFQRGLTERAMHGVARIHAHFGQTPKNSSSW